MMPTGPVRFLARNANTGRVIADRVGIAADRVSRAVGLLTRSGLVSGEALWIVPCRGVHTCGMRFAIDIIALDAEGRIVDAVSDLKPWRLRLPRRGAIGVLELPAGTLEQSKTRIGDEIVFVIDRNESDDPDHIAA